VVGDEARIFISTGPQIIENRIAVGESVRIGVTSYDEGERTNACEIMALLPSTRLADASRMLDRYGLTYNPEEKLSPGFDVAAPAA